jgi:UDPglucose 6-dehydrogenase
MSRIVVVGSGVVGQATGKGFTKKGHSVSYVDINPQTIERLRAAGLRAMTSSEVDWNEVDVVMLAVSTPSSGDKIILDYIEAAALDVGRGLATTSNYVTVVVRSTVPPTTTEQRITPILEQASGKRAGVGFGVGMNPEFLRQVTAEQDFARPWITVLGSSDRHTAELLDTLYAPFGALIVRCTPTEAEMIKYVNNVYNAVKISYFNEVHAICQQLGVDSNLIGSAVARSAESMWNPLYGTRGGVPYGGACLPKDTTAFMGFVREHGFEHLVLEATMESNRRLEARIPAVASPDKIEDALATASQSQPSVPLEAPRAREFGMAETVSL